MSKLKDLKVALAANPAVNVVTIRQRTFDPAGFTGWNDWVDIITAPTGGLYTAKKLEKFMLGMVSITPTQMDSFGQFDTTMRFGKLYFDETVGTIVTAGTRVTTVTDPDVVLPEGFKSGAVVDLAGTTEMRRRTLLWVYPDEAYAQRAMDDEDVYQTSRRVIVPWGGLLSRGR